ncbi:MAG: hypothetical protein WA733_16505 [Methylocystis sp.]
MTQFILKKISVAASLIALLIIWTSSVPSAEPTTATSSKIPSLKKSFSAASIRALPGLNCKLYPPGSAPSAGVSLLTDDDGYARFYAVKGTAHDAINRLTLDCADATGKPSNYSVDLTSDETFAPNPINLAKLPGTDRPALQGDPLRYSQSQLLDAGYGLRPDPVKNPKGYARWLAAASAPGRLLRTPNAIIPQPHPFPPENAHQPAKNLVVPQQASTWYGTVLTGAPDYIFTSATFYVPQAIPGGDNTGNTAIYIWNGLGGSGTGSGLIQGILWIQTTATAATYSTFREYCCGDCQYTIGPNNCNPPPTTGSQGFFSPSPGDHIFDQAWYCDATGNQNINGGYGCVFMQDLTTGAIVSCTSYLASPCSSVKALPLCSVSATTPNCMTLGKSAEFIIENGTSGALTDFVVSAKVLEQFAGVQMNGSATNTSGASYGPGNDPTVTLYTDTSASAHASPYMAVSIDQLVSATCFTISASFAGPLASCGGVYFPPGGGGCYLNGIPIRCPGCNPDLPSGEPCRLQ